MSVCKVPTSYESRTDRAITPSSSIWLNVEAACKAKKRVKTACHEKPDCCAALCRQRRSVGALDIKTTLESLSRTEVSKQASSNIIIHVSLTNWLIGRGIADAVFLHDDKGGTMRVGFPHHLLAGAPRIRWH